MTRTLTVVFCHLVKAKTEHREREIAAEAEVKRETQHKEGRGPTWMETLLQRLEAMIPCQLLS